DRGEDDEDEEHAGPAFPWEDEKTLVSDLMDEYDDGGDDEQYSDEQLTSLADSIEDSLMLHSKELSEDAAETLVPAVNRVKQAHQALKVNADYTFGAGVLEFDEACKTMEAVTLNEFDELKELYRDTRLRIVDLFKELQEAYTRRDQLWLDLDKALDEAGMM
ncbi:hypothetical protein K435DRAFT_690636, partial [Dendrothele bispora CBS 962.96]